VEDLVFPEASLEKAFMSLYAGTTEEESHDGFPGELS
jgi:hypothetical protein